MHKHQEITLVAIFGMIGNIILLSAKLIVGLMSNSQAMIADGLNSAGDVFASLMTFIGNKISSKPEDNNHPYGHGKAEYIFAMIISISLILVAFTIFRNAFDALTIKSRFTYSVWLVIVALFTIFLKLLLFLYARAVGKKYNSLLAIANAQDHRNDILLSGLTLLSIVSGYYHFQFVDGIVGIFISFWIAFTGIKIFNSAYTVLMDTNVTPEFMHEIAIMLIKIPGVEHIDAIISKPLGLNFLLIIKVSVDANLTVYEGHQISDSIKLALLALENIQDVIVHINPAQYHPQYLDI